MSGQTLKDPSFKKGTVKQFDSNHHDQLAVKSPKSNHLKLMMSIGAQCKDHPAQLKWKTHHQEHSTHSVPSTENDRQAHGAATLLAYLHNDQLLILNILLGAGAVGDIGEVGHLGRVDLLQFGGNHQTRDACRRAGLSYSGHRWCTGSWYCQMALSDSVILSSLTG